MTLSCLSKCSPGDRVTICYSGAFTSRMTGHLTPHQREFIVIKMTDYYGGDGRQALMVPIVGSDSDLDGMLNSGTYDSDGLRRFKYEWVVHPSYNFVVKIRKQK